MFTVLLTNIPTEVRLMFELGVISNPCSNVCGNVLADNPLP